MTDRTGGLRLVGTDPDPATIRTAATRRAMRVVGLAACVLCVLAYLAGQAVAGETAGQAALLGGVAAGLAAWAGLLPNLLLAGSTDPAAAVRRAMLSQLVRLGLVGVFGLTGLVLTPRLGLPREAFLLAVGLVYLLLLPLEVWAALPPPRTVDDPEPPARSDPPAA